MKKIPMMQDETLCHECGGLVSEGKGCFIGDENWEVPVKSLCNECIEKIYKIITKKEKGNVHETRCYECGEYIRGGQGCYIGNENKNARQRSLCNECIEKLYKIHDLEEEVRENE